MNFQILLEHHDYSLAVDAVWRMANGDRETVVW